MKDRNGLISAKGVMFFNNFSRRSKEVFVSVFGRGSRGAASPFSRN